MFPVTLLHVFEIAERIISLSWNVVLFFSKVTGEVYAVCNSDENSNTSIGLFQKEAFLEILRPLLNEVAGLQSVAYSLQFETLLQNKLQTKFLTGALKPMEILQQVIPAGVPLYGELHPCKLQPSAMRVFKTHDIRYL